MAIDPKTGERYHIESTVSVSRKFSKLTADPYNLEAYKQPVNKAPLRRTIEFFHVRKFTPEQVLDTLAGYGFQEGEYHRVIVSWDWTPDAEEQATSLGIELWRFPDILRRISEALDGTRTYFSDDTLRTLQLFARAQHRVDRS